MQKLSFRHYRAIHAFRSHGRLVTAAEAIGLTTSAVSYQLSEAERRLGCKLFKRVGRNLTLTTEGDLLATSAESILREARMVEEQLNTAQIHKTTIRIGTFAYPSYRWLIPFLVTLKHEMPNVDFEFVTGFHRLPQESLRNAEVDICIVNGDVQDDDIQVYPLFADELVAICPTNHPLSKHAYLEAHDFQRETFITYSTISEVGLDDDKLWRPAGCRPYKMLKAGFADAVIDLVAADLGVSILSKWVVEQHPHRSSLACVPITGLGLSVRWNCVFRQQHHDAALLPSIAEKLRDWCAKTNFPQNL